MSSIENRATQLPLRTKLTNRVLHAFGLTSRYHDLSSILAGGSMTSGLSEKIVWLAQLITWIRGPVITYVASGPKQAVVRIRFFIQILERHEEHRRMVSRVIGEILNETEAPSLFAQTELAEQGGVFTEIARRLSERLLPPPPRPHELAYTIQIAFTGDYDDEWLAAIPDDDWLKLCDLLFGKKAALVASSPQGQTIGESPAHIAPASTSAPVPASASARATELTTDGYAVVRHLEGDLCDSVLNLAMRAAALGLAPDVRERTRSSGLGSGGAPFVVMSRLAFRWRDAVGVVTEGSLPSSGDSEPLRVLKGAITSAHAAVSEAYRGVEERGVSLALVYRLETISSLLRRMELLLSLLNNDVLSADRRLRAKTLLVQLVRTRLSHRSLKALLDLNFDIFARRLVNTASETGEHYITRTRAEYFEMLWAGAGGGLITVGTALLKFVITYFHSPLFIEGLMLWVNYSASFMLIQVAGFTLATKQPSMTAAALASKLSGAMNRVEIYEFVEEVARISRSQFIAAVGNVGFVVPGAYIANFVYSLIFHRPVISAEYAEKTLASLHPWQSFSLYYAAITGILLWLSSFGAGWLENWVVYRGLRESIAESRTLRSMFGEKRTRAFGESIRHNASGIGGNIAIGFLLASVPVAGNFFGLPLDVRHVTLSSGAATFAFCSLGAAALTWQKVGIAALGLVMIGFLNFMVSMACALFVASRAQKVRRTWFRAFFSATGILFRKRPLRFFFPPPDKDS